MTSPYDQNLPCLNPQCHSHGKPHPNCKCYGGLAEGGEVEHFCSKDREHDPSCEYFMADGGSIDPSQVQMDQPQIDPSKVELDSAPQIDPSQVQVDEEPVPNKYGTLEQQVKTGLEGAAQGIAGPAATYAETHLLGVNPEDIKGRQQENPLIHGGAEAATLVGGLLTGTGEAGLIAKGAGAVAKAANMGKIGSLVLKGAIETASFAASDEITKGMLSVPGSDPETPTSAALLHVGAAGLLGALTGGVFSLGEGMIGKGLEKLGNEKMISKMENFLAKVGESKDPLGDLGVTDKISGGLAKTVAWPLAVKTGTGQMGYEAIQQAISKPISKIIDKANPYVTDAAIKSILTNELSGLPNAVHYGMQVAKGAQKALRGVDALFTAGSSQIATPVSDSARNHIKDFIENGQVDQQMQNSMSEQPQGFAKGGKVSSPNDGFAKVFPEQNTLLNAAKGRISTYLNGIRPLSNQPKLAFDKPNPQAEKKRSYEKAIDFAANPLSILDKINTGDLTPEHMQHFKGLYPDIHKYLSQEMTKKITKAQLKDEVPPYKKRQAMSLFLGTDLDSTLAPQSIMTIQALYAAKSMQQAPVPQKPKKEMSSKAPNSYLTDEQARIQRGQNAKA